MVMIDYVDVIFGLYDEGSVLFDFFGGLCAVVTYGWFVIERVGVVSVVSALVCLNVLGAVVYGDGEFFVCEGGEIVEGMFDVDFFVVMFEVRVWCLGDCMCLFNMIGLCLF